MTPEQQVYDFETVIPVAFANALTSQGLVAITPLSDPKFQNLRPRTEVTFKLGGAVTPLRIAPSTVPDGWPILAGRNSAWTGEVTFHAITDAAPPGKLVHSEYRATVRNVLATIFTVVNNGTNLPYHSINSLVESSTTHGVRTNDGFEQSSITYHTDFSLNAAAWPFLASSGTN
jgi:hypothetical protein